MRRVFNEGDDLAIAPNAALFDGCVVAPAIPPDGFDGFCKQRSVGIAYFEEAAAGRAIVDNFGYRIPGSATFFEADELCLFQPSRIAVWLGSSDHFGSG